METCDNSKSSTSSYIPLACLVNDKWKLLEYLLPADPCDGYNYCGPNGLCDINTSWHCNCIKGFRAIDPEAWDLRDRTRGCRRKTELSCSGDKFLELKKMKLPDTRESIVDLNIGLKECKDKCLKNCNCTAYANSNMQNGGSGCVIWVGGLLDLRKNKIAGQDLFVRLAASDIGEEGNKNTKIISLIVGVSIFVLLSFIIFLVWKRKKNLTRAIAAPIEDIPFTSMDLEDIITATKNFSETNRIGQGGFGIVYKGRLLDGQEIAAKRLLKMSTHGIQGFYNELRLIATVQHVNLVRLIGYCSERGQMILVYEYLENSSLDSYIFDKTQSCKLNWERRFQIINGIARGLLYLHQDSRTRIIHLDLKPSNILLDKDMIPKISDFGMAKIFRQDETEANTTNVAGTYGYMSPEYVNDGIYSIKSDVYSFGVLVLELLYGKRNREDNLLSSIWNSWKEGKGLDIIDRAMIDSSSAFRPHEILSCIHIGLLCVQECAEDRPTMLLVFVMLTTQSMEIGQPKPPGYFAGTSPSDICSSSSNQPNLESWTVAQVTNSTIEGR